MKKITLNIQDCILISNVLSNARFSIPEILVLDNLNKKINIFREEMIKKHNTRIKYDENNNVSGIEWDNGDGEMEYKLTDDEIKIIKKAIQQIEETQKGIPANLMPIIVKFFKE